ncbi:glycosyltransferase family 2 protein [Spirochaetota bacterium]
MKNSKLSIITVSKNAGDTIEKTIQSVINQTYKNIEYIIIDGASTDNTIEIINKYIGEITKFISEPDEGIYDGMNKGIDYSTGDWIYFLGADDILFSNDIIEKVFRLSFVDENDIVYGDVKFKHSGIIYDGYFDIKKLTRQNICHQAIFTKRKLFDQMDKFNLSYKVLADWNFNLRCMSNPEIKCAYVDLVISEYNERGYSFHNKDDNFLHDHTDLLDVDILISHGYVCEKTFNRLLDRNKELLDQNKELLDHFKNIINSRDFIIGKYMLEPLRIIRRVFRKIIGYIKVI